MRAVQQVVFGITGQTLIADALEGRPSSVTDVQVFPATTGDDGTEEIATTGSASVETNPNTTLDGLAGPGQTNSKNIPLTATTGVVVGRLYLVTGATGLKEWVEVDDITSADSVRAKYPLHNNYASGATFVSTRMSIGIDSTWVSDSNNLSRMSPNPEYRVRWTYVFGGITYVVDRYFQLVRYAGTHGVTPSDIELLVPGWLDRLPIDHRVDQGRRLIDDAYRAVRIDLHELWRPDWAIAQAEIVDELVRYKVVSLGEWARFFSTAGGAAAAGDRDRLENARNAYEHRFASLVKVTEKVPVRAQDGGAHERIDGLPISVR